MKLSDWQKAEEALKKGGVAFVPTDTLYGLVASALDKKAVERIYKIRGRDKGKPCIVLISSFADLKKFGVSISIEQKKFLESIWPGKVSVILPCTARKFQYLHRGTKTIAFRMIGPKNKNLFKILESVGPLIAPSANPQGLPPARKRSEGRKYFGKSVDAYVCVGTKISKPSTLIEYKNNKLKVLREGAVKIKKD
jgi:L-threonylcarbamoyladenylate synthase